MKPYQDTVEDAKNMYQDYARASSFNNRYGHTNIFIKKPFHLFSKSNLKEAKQQLIQEEIYYLENKVKKLQNKLNQMSK